MERLLLQEPSDGSFTLVLLIPGPGEVRNNLGEVREVAGPPEGESAPAPLMYFGLPSFRELPPKALHALVQLDRGWIIAIQGLRDVPSEVRQVLAADVE
eukprot:14213868-Alexandrium_andersonii.AAC.1